jgi:hypothetical protein
MNWTEDDAKDYQTGDASHVEFGPFCFCNRRVPCAPREVTPDALQIYCYSCGNEWAAFGRSNTAPPYNDGTRPEETL